MNELPAISLDGFEPSWGTTEYEWGTYVTDGDGVVRWYNQYHAEILARFDHDYLGAHLFVQVWDYVQQDDPDQRWQYMLLLHRPVRFINAEGDVEYTDWAWTIRTEYEVGKPERPTYARVGADVDLWVESPDYLRFIVE